MFPFMIGVGRRAHAQSAMNHIHFIPLFSWQKYILLPLILNMILLGMRCNFRRITFQHFILSWNYWSLSPSLSLSPSTYITPAVPVRVVVATKFYWNNHAIDSGRSVCDSRRSFNFSPEMSLIIQEAFPFVEMIVLMETQMPCTAAGSRMERTKTLRCYN